MNNKILVHRTYFQQGDDLAVVFKKSMAWGYDGVEISLPRENLQSALEEMARLKEKYRVPNVVLSGFAKVTTDQDQQNLDTEIAFFTEAISKAKAILGVSLINTGAGGELIAKGSGYTEFWNNGSAIATDAHYERAARAFKSIAEVAQAENVKLALEIHNCYIHDLPETTHRLLEMIDSSHVGCNFDEGNMYLHEKWLVDPAGFLVNGIELLAEKIFYVHLKNVRKVGELLFFCPDLQDGEIDNRLFLSTLKRIGYNGYLVPEHVGRGDGELSAKRDLAYIKELKKCVSP